MSVALQLRLKRCLDITASCILLTLGSPFLFLSMVAIWLTSGTPLIFRQVRGGYLGQPFTLYKLRTMYTAESGVARITPIGRALRRFSVDELPQLWNVLRGDMSLIGPRPLLASYLSRYNEHQAKRHQVRPGITGYAQVVGRHALTWEQKFELDVWYATNWTLALDFRIALLTVWTVLTARNADKGDTPSESEFFAGQPGVSTVELGLLGRVQSTNADRT